MTQTSETLPKTGYTKASAGNFLLNAGAWVKNLKWVKGDSGAEGKWSYDLIGATSDGSKITLKNTYRQVQIDGVLTTPVGADMIEEIEGVVELNMIEHTLENMKMLLLASSKKSTGEDFPPGYEVIKPKAQVGESDYIENLGYIGTLSGSDKPVIIIIDYAICTSGLELEPKDKSEAVYTAVFEVRTGPDNLQNQALPVTILFPIIEEGQQKQGLNVKNKVDGDPNNDVDENDDKGGKK